jgi:hypothetical protein
MAVLRVLALAAICMCGSALAQSGPPPRNNAIVYKCVNPDGTVVYSQDACSTDPKKMQILDTSGALRTGSGGSQDEISASVADSDCRSNAYASTHAGSEAKVAESNKHIADYRQRREELQSQINYAGDAADPASRKAVDELDSAIAQESEFQQKEVANVEQAYQDALKACDLLKGRGTDNAAPKPAPAPAPASEEPAPAPAQGEPPSPAAPAPAEDTSDGGG